MQDPTTCCQQETHFKYEDIEKLQEKGWKNTNAKQKKTGVISR